MSRAESTTTVEHEKGLHARPASLFVQTASEYDCDIEVSTPGERDAADAKSSIAIMSLGVETGTTITISAEGSDAESAVETLTSLVESDFSEGAATDSD